MWASKAHSTGALRVGPVALRAAGVKQVNKVRAKKVGHGLFSRELAQGHKRSTRRLVA